MSNLLIPHVKQHYRLLNHQGLYSQLHAQDKQAGKLLDRRLINNENALTDWVKEFNGRADLYIGRNPRTEDGKVAAVRSVSIDIDPVRVKDTASTTKQLQEAIAAGSRLRQIPLYSKGILASSGNGCHMYWPVQKDWAVTQQQVQQFEAEIRDIIEGEFNVKVDAIHDSPRLVKIIGTTATKGDPKLHRVSRFLHPINWGQVFDRRIYDRLHTYKDSQSGGGIAPILQQNIRDRSAEDFKLAINMLRSGSSFSDTCSFLKARGYKAPGREDSYTINTVRRAQEELNKSGGSVIRSQSEPEQKPLAVFTPSTHTDAFITSLEHTGNEPIELSTGFPTLDSYTGGLKRKSLWVVGARTGIGKTGFSATVAEHLLQNNKRVLIFGTETTWETIFARFASMGTGISLHKITDHKEELTDRDRKELADYARTFKSKALYIVEESQPNIRAVAEEISRIRPDVFIFDYIQHIEESADNRHREIGKFIKGLEDVAKATNSAGLVASQLNRAAETETPRLAHLSDSSTIENTAHAVILLSQLAVGDTGSITIADLAKNRGPKGRIEMQFDAVTARFEELPNEQA